MISQCPPQTDLACDELSDARLPKHLMNECTLRKPWQVRLLISDGSTQAQTQRSYLAARLFFRKCLEIIHPTRHRNVRSRP